MKTSENYEKLLYNSDAQHNIAQVEKILNKNNELEHQNPTSNHSSLVVSAKNMQEINYTKKINMKATYGLRGKSKIKDSTNIFGKRYETFVKTCLIVLS